MKECYKCKMVKSKSEFGKQTKHKDGLHSYCKECYKIIYFEYRRSKNGLITKIYSHQKQTSKRRGKNLPNYSKEELKNWVFSRSNFEDLWNNYVKSNYDTNLIPSVDRKKDDLPYTLDNIQLVTWKENNNKAKLDFKNGILKVGRKKKINN